jgi:hypothetical protein
MKTTLADIVLALAIGSGLAALILHSLGALFPL